MKQLYVTVMEATLWVTRMLLENCFYVTSVSAYVIRYHHVLIGNLASTLCESCFPSYHHHGNKCTSHSVQGRNHSAARI